MAEYVADVDEDYFAELSGTYSHDESNKVLTLGSDGEGDTTFVLPASTAWLLVEVYDVEGVYGNIGYQRYTDNITNIDFYIERIRSLATIEYTTFKITAIHYYGDNTGDTYRGDESVVATLDATSTGYTPPIVSWKLSTDLITPLNKILVCDESYDCDVAWLC